MSTYFISLLAQLTGAYTASAQSLFGVSTSVNSFGDFVKMVIGIIKNVAIPTLLSVAVIIFFVGIIRTYIWNSNNPEAIQKNKFYVLWGIGGIFVMLAIWGIINVISSTTGIGLGGDISIPQFTKPTTP